MRPLRLETHAIGPFLQRTRIDFDRLAKGDLFLVYGPTGIGKSFILDAICYALYADTPSHRGSNLKSDFAQKDVEPFIEFSFALGNDIYRVCRKLEYERTPKRKSASSAIIEKESGFLEKLSSWPDGSTTLLCTKKSEITKRCVELIGLDPDQFVQVILIPQGEFRRLLLADSSQREDLLETLFNSSIYGDIQRELNQNRQNKERAVVDDMKTIEMLIEQSKSHIPAAFLEKVDRPDVSTITLAIEQYMAELPEMEDKIIQSRIALNASSERLAGAQNIVALFSKRDELEQIAERLKREEVQTTQELKRELLADQESSKIIMSIQQSESIHQEVLNGKTESNRLRECFERSIENLQKASHEAEQLAFITRNRDIMVEKIARLKGLVGLSQELDEIMRQIADSHKRLDSYIRSIHQSEQMVAETRRTLSEMEYKLKKLREETVDMVATQMCIDEAEQVFLLMSNLHSIVQKVKVNRKELHCIEQEKGEIERDLQKERHQRELNLAGELAATLQEGKSCPVCGSRHHPCPAMPSDRKTNLDVIQEKELSLSSVTARLNRTIATIEGLMSQEKETRQRIDSLRTKHPHWSMEDKEAFEVELKIIRQEYEQKKVALDNKIKLEAMVETIRNVDLPKAETESSNEKNKVSECERNLHVLQAMLKDKRQRWHSEIDQQQESYWPRGQTSQQNLADWIEKLESEKSAVNDQIGRIRKTEQQAREQFATLKGKVSAQEELLSKLEQKAQRLGEECERLVETSPFQSIAEVKSAHREDEWRDITNRRVEEFRERQNENQTLLRNIAKELDGINLPDISQLEIERKECQQVNQDIIIAVQETNQRLKVLKRVREDIEQLLERSTAIQNELEILAKLDDQIRGQGTPKISLKRYFLAQRLEEVLIQASHRLSILSRGRFTLKRASHIKHQSSQTGLDLNIFDNHTGTERPAVTLSGGQMFLASLSLALGLADVVQSRTGGIDLEALFIDEGFGSLDEETLQLSLEVLNELCKGRMVGIISHISELKQQICNCIEVKEANIGSTVNLVVSGVSV